MGRVQGKIALVTGGASGIGRGCVETLAREGATVVITDLQDAKGEALAAEVGGSAVYLHQDTTSEDEWIAIIGEIEKRFGRLDVLVNNAGIAIGSPSITNFTLADFKKQQAVNVEGVFLGLKHSIPLMRKGGGGCHHPSSTSHPAAPCVGQRGSGTADVASRDAQNRGACSLATRAHADSRMATDQRTDAKSLRVGIPYLKHQRGGTW